MADDANYRFRRSQRLRKQREFDAVYQARGAKRAGPLRVHSRPNALDYTRLGLSVSRRVGNAVRRNRIKRLLREAFRLSQHDLPTGYDLVVVVLPHRELTLAEYQALLADAAAQIDHLWRRRLRRDDDRKPNPRHTTHDEDPRNAGP